jgi:hypothetical protein
MRAARGETPVLPVLLRPGALAIEGTASGLSVVGLVRIRTDRNTRVLFLGL